MAIVGQTELAATDTNIIFTYALRLILVNVFLQTIYLIRCSKTMIHFDAIIQWVYLLSISSLHPVFRCKNTSPGAKDNRGLGRDGRLHSLSTTELIWHLTLGFISANPLLTFYQPIMNKQIWSFPLPCAILFYRISIVWKLSCLSGPPLAFKVKQSINLHNGLRLYLCQPKIEGYGCV